MFFTLNTECTIYEATQDQTRINTETSMQEAAPPQKKNPPL